jgi:DNA-binding PadR family transcriptional regulator
MKQEEPILKGGPIPVGESEKELNQQIIDDTKSEKFDELNDHLIKALLDIIVLELLHDSPKHGYKTIAEIHKQFGVMLSPGTVYPLLYELEKVGWVEIIEEKRKKVYSLTSKGTNDLKILSVFYLDLFRKITKLIEENADFT